MQLFFASYLQNITGGKALEQVAQRRVATLTLEVFKGSLEKGLRTTFMSSFRNGTLQFSAPAESMLCSLAPSFPFPQPCLGWRGELEAQKAKIVGWVKEQCAGNRNEIMKQTVQKQY